MTLLAFIFLIGPLITLHELGHFLVAKATGVRVLVFSLGFGPRLIGFRRGDTDYRLSMFPLGGYVRMYGDESQPDVPENERHYAFLDKPWAVKVAIAVAGPLANLLLPLVLFFGLNLGEKQVIAPVVGAVLAGEAGARAGLLPGDRIQAVAGTPTPTFDALLKAVSARPNQVTELEVLRGGSVVRLTATPSPAPNPNPFDDDPVGRLGLLASQKRAVISVEAGSVAATAGFVTGDRVVAVNGAAVVDRDAFFAAFDAIDPLTPLPLTVERTTPPDPKNPEAKASTQTTTLTLPPAPTTTLPCPEPPPPPDPSTTPPSTEPPSTDPPPPACTPQVVRVERPAGSIGERRFAVVADDLADAKVKAVVDATRAAVADALAADWRRRGIAAHEGTVRAVIPETPAAARGLEKDKHRVVAVDGAPLSLGIDLANALRKDVDAIHAVGFVDDAGHGEVFVTRLQKAVAREAAGQKVLGLDIAVDVGGAVIESRTLGVVDAAIAAAIDTKGAIVDVVFGFKLMFTGRVGLDQLGGPVLIANVANEAAKSGLETFIGVMAMFSVNLGLLNLLPIPILDGGHIVIVTVEALRRKKLDVQQRNRVMLVGLILVGALMLVAGYNDVTSLFR